MLDIEKIVVSHSVAMADQKKVEQAFEVVQEIFLQKPIFTVTRKELRGFGLSKGKRVGVMVTLRRKKASDFFRKFLEIKKGFFYEHQFSGRTLSFGVHSHLFFENQSYDPRKGIFGFYVTVTFDRAGYRVLRKKYNFCSRISKDLQILPREVIDFLVENYDLKVVNLDTL